MRLRAAPPFRTPPTTHSAVLRCDTLEAREVPTANLMGVNLSGVDDWSADRLFADAMKSARRPSTYGSHEGTPPIDANGWPLSDCSYVLWHNISNMNGVYRLSFNGQADLTTAWGAATIANQQYNPATNTTTATITYWPNDGNGLLLNLANTRRTPNGPTNTGVTNVKLMRPISPGSTVSYDPSVTFTQPIKDLVSKFSVVRMMDDTGSNGFAVNGNWNTRRPADYASQAADGAAKGMAWEYAIQFWNETDKDAWVNIPFTADDNYVTQLATLLKNSLEPGRKLYVEFSNEVWNTADPFPGEANRQAAIAEVQANPNSPLNFDGVYPSRDPNGWTIAARRIALRTVQVSNIFRQVFGDDQMMSRVRPVLMSQLGWTNGWLAPELDFMEDYFDGATYQATPHAPSYFLYGAGGSAYEDADWSKGANTTVDDVFNTMPLNFAQNLQSDLDWVSSFGLKRIAYEGGPSLDNLTANQSVPGSVLEAAWNDPRMRTEMVANHNTWSANGGDLFMYFASTGDYHWGLTHDPFNLNTPKLQAINDLNAQPAVPVTYGKLAPLDLTTTDFRVPAGQGTIADMRANSLTQEWNGALFRLDAAGDYDVRLTGTASSGGQVEVFVDGKSLGLVNVPSGGDTARIHVGTLAAGEHGIVLRARSGSFGIGRVSVLAAGTTDTTSSIPATPSDVVATPVSATSVNVTWTDTSTNETSFLIERADDANFTTGRTAFGVMANTTSYTDNTVAPGATYYYRVFSLNGLNESPAAGPAAATTPTSTPPPPPAATGLLATYFDNSDLSGPYIARTDPTVNFNWASGVSPVGGLAPTTYSVRWLGQIQTVEGGNYRFRTESDDGVRLWVNGKLVINNWTDHAGTLNTSAWISLAAGTKYDLRMEYYNNTGGAVARLLWQRPGAAGFVPVPTTQLIPAAGGAALFADGFDTGLGQWSPQSGTWTAPASVAHHGAGYAATGNVPERLTLAGNSGWNNYSVAAWVDLTSLSGGLSILGRVQDATHYYELSIQRNASGQPAWALSRRDGDTWTTLGSGTLSYTAGTWARLRLTMSGSTLRAEMAADGTAFTLLGTATDTRYASGRIGLRSWGPTGYFDEVLVQAT
jgi:hypothetical protein